MQQGGRSRKPSPARGFSPTPPVRAHPARGPAQRWPPTPAGIHRSPPVSWCSNKRIPRGNHFPSAPRSGFGSPGQLSVSLAAPSPSTSPSHASPWPSSSRPAWRPIASARACGISVGAWGRGAAEAGGPSPLRAPAASTRGLIRGGLLAPPFGCAEGIPPPTLRSGRAGRSERSPEFRLGLDGRRSELSAASSPTPPRTPASPARLPPPLPGPRPAAPSRPRPGSPPWARGRAAGPRPRGRAGASGA